MLNFLYYDFPLAGEQNLLFLVLTGLVIGFISGLLGVGGGFILTPFLNIAYGINIILAKGTDLFQILFAAASGGYKHYLHKFVNFKVVLTVACTSCISAWLGSKISFIVPKNTVKLLFALLLLLIALKMLGVIKFGTTRQDVQQVSEISHYTITRALIIGILAGLFCGFFGIGGGVVLVPLLYYYLGLPMHFAIGTSLWIIWFSALSGTITHYLAQKVDIQLGLILALGSVFGAWWGAKMSPRISADKLKVLFSLLLILASLKLGWDSLFTK